MSMVLRSRGSIHPSTASELPARRRTSTRLKPKPTYEETDESEPESVRSQEMETRERLPAELEEEETAELEELEEEEEEEDAAAHVKDLKYCSIVLDRLQFDEKAARRELEDKEDMNRKGGKPVSRIPTFHKRPTNASQPSELPCPKKETPVQGAQPLGKSGSVEASKTKPPDVRDTALPLPVRPPKVGLDAPPPSFSGAEQATVTARSPLVAAPKNWSLSESVQYSVMTASPRPALRPEQGAEQHVPEHARGRTLEIEAEDVQDAPLSHLPGEGAVSQTPPGDMSERRSRISPSASGDTEEPESANLLHTTVSQEEAITDEQPPWETEPMTVLEYKDSRSSSDVECEDEFADEKSEGHESGEETECCEPLVSRSEVPDVAKERADVDEGSSPVAPEKPAKAPSAKSPKSSGCSSFALFCLLPTTLLLLGGFGQHVWLYGLPTSVAQLTAQLELHLLEGFGFEPCSTDCRVQLVESIPEGLYPSSPSSGRSIADSWLRLLDKANSSVHIAAFYFTLRDGEVGDASDSQGRRIFEQLKQLKSKGVTLQIAVNSPQTSTKDTAELAAAGAEVREVDLEAVTGGIVHTKLWVVDQKHFYVGSANMDWRSLTQVKEVGLSVEDCGCLAQDAFRLFGVYWSLGGGNGGSLPLYWPARLSALSSSQNPLQLKFNGVPAQVYLSSSPPQISARGRSDDLATILSVIHDARKFVYISVMDYLPLSEFTKPLRFWPDIDSALRAAACTRGVHVKLLVSCWNHSPAAMFPFLQSLLVLSRPQLKCHVDVKVFAVPSTEEQRKIPFARVNHAKYMVTDRVVYIGTSNWSENYFTRTAGVGLVVNQTGSTVETGQETLQSQAEELFLRDWTSEYTSELSLGDQDVCPRRPH